VPISHIWIGRLPERLKMLPKKGNRCLGIEEKWI